MGELYDLLKKHSTIKSAWRHVKDAASKSKSAETKAEADLFDSKSDTKLRGIQASLRAHSYTFQKSKGIAKRKKPGSTERRPLVVGPIRDRIMQRALLDVMQDKVSDVQWVLDIPTSVGGIRDKGTGDAIKLVMAEAGNGKCFFIRSDISNFFSNIPKPTIRQFFRDAIDDEPFVKLVLSAIEVRLKNEEALKRDDHFSIFPDDTVGFAQGSALSPLVGNIVLRGFDEAMNGRGIVCIRYIDDFILMAERERDLNRAFAKGRQMLKDLGLDCYDPEETPRKAEKGDLRRGAVTFLGCDVSVGMSQPSKEARTKFSKELNRRVSEGIAEIELVMSGLGTITKPRTFINTLSGIERYVNGWGHAYRHCNGEDVWRDLDEEVSAQVSCYLREAERLMGKMKTADKMAVIGIPSVGEISRKVSSASS